ncbi:two-partner secretion domain-containing protein [Moraxella cuniculi]|uniref:p120 n=1 Tax=Moraxella cuniculi TaxID=34061 RepID=A0A448GVR8_9GAMM|nr:filamentous hemagglutinin N-terminal domain-containing protein [Moraxella cuniculi]VEG12924.1 p120 [Moraxella cuniculi]
MASLQSTSPPPNARGLSNNHYSQFDVGSSGVILNNNRQATNTQIAGFVAANPFMARGEASTILNQINSSKPSHLNGFIEVAGKKADVIIANPSGLVVNGAGLINAGNAHLAAAGSQVNQGQVSGYQVSGNSAAHIEVNGKLNLQGTDYAALITKTAQINDKIYAGNTLDIILGENQISLQNGDFTKLNATNKQTSALSASQTTNKEQRGVALDISSLGGMYAGKIHLIGTDKGFGVNNTGVITATGKGVQAGGTLTLDAQGNLVNAGILSAKDKLAINTHNHSVLNDGTLLSEQANLTINTKDLESAGTIHSTQTTQIDATDTLNNQGSIYGGVLQLTTNQLDNTGKLIQTGTGRLNISTDTLTNSNKAVIGQSLYEQTTLDAPSTPSSDQSAGTIGSDSKDNTTANTANSSNPSLPATTDTTQSIPVPSADGFITAKSLTNTNDQALITATGDISITANQTKNTNQASIDAQTLNTKTLTNTDSKIALDTVNWQLTSFDNSKGDISAKDGMVIDSESTIINAEGSLTSGGDMILIAKDSIINQDGTITAVKQADITAKELQNGGTITADTLTITQQADYTHTDQDKLVANRLAFTTSGKLINQSQFTADQDLTLNANDITNQGLINSENTFIKAAGTIDNLAGGRIYGTHLAITADTLNNTPAKASDTDSHHTAPVIAARERLDIGVNTLNNNPNPDRAGKFNENFDSQALITSLDSLNIGGSLDDNHHATGKAEAIINNGATIESGGQMQVNTKTLLNTNADFNKHTVKVEEESVYGQTLYRNREQSGAAPVIQKSTNTDDLGNKPMAGLFDCPEGSDCIINYGNDSAIWSYFKIEPPKEPIPSIKAQDLLDEPDLPENETTQSCALAPKSNQACTQYNEDLANYTKAMAPLLTWEQNNAAAIEALELAIRAYNRQFNKTKSDVDLALNIYTTDEAYLGPTSRKGAPTGALYVKQANGSHQRVGEEIDEITVDFVVYEDKTLTSDPARMVAGGNLIIQGNTLINDKSQINAGAGFAVLGDTVIQNPDNGLYGEKTKVTENGRFISRTVVSSGAGRRHKRIDIGSGAFVQSFAPLATYELPILNATINTTASSTRIDKPATINNNSVIIDINSNDNNIIIPTSALYTINADDPNQPLIQTDAAFTNYKQWLSSDYMLKALQSDPNHIHKRLSDGYKEQQYLKEQYQLLTGRHINTDYTNQEQAFKQLMNQGITAAKQFGYTLGTALTPDQMANLTTDIVWLVKESITYTTKDKDGNTITKTQDALVPKLYLRSANITTGTLSPDGRYAAMSGKNINIELTGNLDNNGNVIAKDSINITANNATNKGAVQGNFIAITANNDITNHGTIYANSAMSLDAKNQIINESLTATQTNTQGQSSSSNTTITHIATIRVGDGLKDQTDEQGNPLTTLNIQAGNYVLNKAANIQNDGGSTDITAENGIDIGTVTVSNHISAVADDNNYFKYSQTEDVGPNISSYGDTVIATTGQGADITGKAANIRSGGVSAVIATGGVHFSEGRATSSTQSSSTHQQSKWYGSKDITKIYESSSNTAVLSSIDGDEIYVISKNSDIDLFGTNITANEQASISAKQGDVAIESVKDRVYQNTIQTTQNFYKNTGNVDGFYQETLAQTGVRAGSIDIQGNSTNLNAVKLQAPNGVITVGNAHLATNDDGTLKLDDNGKPIVLSGDMQHLNLGTVDLTNKTWQESSSSYRGFVKDVMKGVGVVTGALGLGKGIALAESQSNHTTVHTQATTQLNANQIHLGASQVTAQGSVIDAGDDGFVSVLGDDILFTTAKHSQTNTQTQTRQTITGEGMQFGKDRLQLGAVVYTDTTDTQTTQSTTHDGVTVRGNSAAVLGDMNDGSLTTQATNFDLDRTSGTLLIGAKNTLLDGAINQSTHTQSNETNTTRLEASIHHAAVDTAVAAENVKEAIQSANHARKALENAQDEVAAGKLEADAINDYEANLAMATANIANAQIALGAVAASAANTAPTLGFSAKLGATHTQSQSHQTQTNQDFVSTQITAANTTLVGDEFTTKGLQADIDKLNIDHLNKLTLTHATTQDTSQSKSSTSTIDASISTSGNLSAGMGRQQSHSHSTSTTAHDTKLNLGELNGHAKNTTLHGATINAQGGHYSTDTLNITTSQNTQKSQSGSKGGNIGVGTNSLSLGYNQQNSQSDITASNTPSGIVYITTDNTGNKPNHSLTANHTSITGGIIAAINVDEQGNQTNGQLNFTTNTLITQDLLATESSQNKGFGINVGFTNKQGDIDLSNIGISANNQGHDKQTLALATIGQGATINNTITHNGQRQTTTDLSQTNINTDALNTQKVIKDQKTGGLDINTTIDARVFTKTGRQEIKKEQKELPNNAKAAFGMPAIAAAAITTGLMDNEKTINDNTRIQKAKDNLTQARNNLLTGVDKANTSLNAHVDAIIDGDLTDVAQNQDILNELNAQLTQNTSADGTTVFLTENTTNPQGEMVQGLANPTKGHTYLDIDHLDNAIEALNHEITHHNGQGETSATRMGKLGNLAYNIGTSLNQEDINTHRQAITPTTQTLQNLSTKEQLAYHTQNQALLDENKAQLEGEKESDRVWSKDYKLGKGYPKLKYDAGAGEWGSEQASFEVYRDYSIAMGVALNSPVYPDATAALRHYLANSGENYQIDLEGLMKDSGIAPIVQKEINYAQSFIEQNLTSKGTIDFHSTGASGAYAESKNWFYATGGVLIYGGGSATYDGEGNYTMDFNLMSYDRYNWDGGKSVTILGQKITDDQLGAMHRAGIAKEYNMYGAVPLTITWSKDDPKPKITINKSKLR